MMNGPRLKWLSALPILLLASAWACTAQGIPPDPTDSGTSFDEEALWRDLPLPDDAETVPVGKGIDVGFATHMVEPELCDCYAAWLREQGWRQQAPTEAMVTLPHQLRRQDGVDLLIEIQGTDEHDRIVVWLQIQEP